MSVHHPSNILTQAMDRVAEMNRGGVPRSAGVASATSPPTARSADLGTEVPLSEAERAELDAKARAAGIVDPRLGPAPEGAYPSLDEAIAAGAPARSARITQDRVTVPPVAVPRLPNFRNVQGIDLLRNRVLVDDMEFPITEDQAREFKLFVVETARGAILEKLSEADGLFATPETVEVTVGPSSESEDVQQQSGGSSTEPPL